MERQIIYSKKRDKDMIDGHIHLEKGNLTLDYLQEFVNEAKNKGLDTIQILDHTHRFKEFKPIYENLFFIKEQKEWLDNKFESSINEYLELIDQARKKDFGIKILFGLEVCYTKKNEELMRKILNNYHFDFLVGAIHSINDRLYDMPFSKEILWDKYNVNQIYEDYYEEILSLINSGLFTQLAHPDTIKLFNYYPSYDLSETYIKIAYALNKMKMKAECNTGCHYRYGHEDIGLSDQLLKTFISNKVEIITASDAHYPKHVGMDIKEANERMKTFSEKCK